MAPTSFEHKLGVSHLEGLARSGTVDPLASDKELLRRLCLYHQHSPRASGQPRHDVLDDGVLLDGVGGHVLAAARLFEASVWHLGRKVGVLVDPHGATPEPPRRV